MNAPSLIYFCGYLPRPKGPLGGYKGEEGKKTIDDIILTYDDRYEQVSKDALTDLECSPMPSCPDYKNPEVDKEDQPEETTIARSGSNKSIYVLAGACAPNLRLRRASNVKQISHALASCHPVGP